MAVRSKQEIKVTVYFSGQHEHPKWPCNSIHYLSSITMKFLPEVWVLGKHVDKLVKSFEFLTVIPALEVQSDFCESVFPSCWVYPPCLSKRKKDKKLIRAFQSPTVLLSERLEEYTYKSKDLAPNKNS